MARPAAGVTNISQTIARELAEVREVLLARVVLQVGVGDERADRVENDGGVGSGLVDAGRILVAEGARANPCCRGSAASAAASRAAERDQRTARH